MKELLTKIATIKSSIGALSKNANNPFFKSKYLDLGEILLNLEPLLEANQMLLLQPIVNDCVVTQIYDLESSQVIESSIKLPALTDAQKIGSAITYYRRYSLQSLLSLQTEDDDGNKASKVDKTPIIITSQKIENCTTLDDLGTVWNSLSKDEQKQFVALKDAKKLQLSKKQ